MLFNSFEFLIFFPIVLALFFATPQRWRWILLLAVSYYFYACWKVEYTFLLAFITLINYFAGLQIGKAAEKSRQKKYLALSLASSLGMLFIFKYLNFVNESLRAAFSAFNIFYQIPAFKLLLPIGISFYTFQTLSYTIDVYRGKRAPEKHLGKFALFASFFPLLLAGPIERSTNLLPQFHQENRFDWERIKTGCIIMLWGFFKKIVIADRLAIYVNAIFNQPGDYYGMHVILAAIFFAFQIYCDFSGYTDIAIGAAQIMGYKLMDNFRRPFAARTVREFWQRWHISLTKWILEYLYFPLAKKATKKWQGYLLTFAVFVVIGLWHGAAWNYILFGAFVGLFLVFAEITRPYRKKMTDTLFPPDNAWLQRLHSGLQILVVFLIFVFAGVLFRANSVPDVMIILRNMFRELRFTLDALVLPNFSLYELMIAGLAIVTLEIVQWLQQRQPVFSSFAQRPLWAQYAISQSLCFSILMFGEFNLAPFIYFQF